MKSKFIAVLAFLLPIVAFSGTTATTAKKAAAVAATATPTAPVETVLQAANFKFGAATTEKLNDVTLSDSAKVDIGGKTVELKRVAAGLRQKKVAIIWASVYVAQIFSNGKIDTSSISALRDSLASNTPAIISMTFVRGVGIDKIVDAYKEDFTENGLNASAEPYSKLLDGIKTSGEVKDTQTYWFLFTKDGVKEQMSFQTNGKEYFSLSNGEAGSIKNLLLMWLGKPADSGLEKLQDQFVAKDKK